jgi:hypothetical protein
VFARTVRLALGCWRRGGANARGPAHARAARVGPWLACAARPLAPRARATPRGRGRQHWRVPWQLCPLAPNARLGATWGCTCMSRPPTRGAQLVGAARRRGGAAREERAAGGVPMRASAHARPPSFATLAAPHTSLLTWASGEAHTDERWRGAGRRRGRLCGRESVGERKGSCPVNVFQKKFFGAGPRVQKNPRGTPTAQGRPPSTRAAARPSRARTRPEPRLTRVEEPAPRLRARDAAVSSGVVTPPLDARVSSLCLSDGAVFFSRALFRCCRWSSQRPGPQSNWRWRRGGNIPPPPLHLCPLLRLPRRRLHPPLHPRHHRRRLVRPRGGGGGVDLPALVLDFGG